MKEGNALSLPKGWGMKKLGEVAKAIYGYTEKASFEEIGPRFLRITDIQDEGVNWETVPFCKITDADFNKYKLIDGDIVFARTGATTGKSYLVNNPPKSVFASYLIKVHINSEGLLPEYLFLFFQTKTYWDSINEGISGSAQGGFNASKLSDLYIPLPPLSEQQRIVVVLDEAFATIAKAKANAEQNLKNAKELFESYLQGVFENKGEDWKEKTLKEVCAKITDGTHQTPKYFDDGIIFLSSKNVTSGTIDWDNIKYIDEKQHLEMHKRVAPRVGDILLAKNGTTGVAAMVDRDIVFDIYVSLAHIRVLDEVTPEFMLYFINSNVAKKQFNKRLKGSGVPNLHLEEIREVLIPFPKSKITQQTIVRKLDALSTETKRLESIYQQKINDLEELKKSVLQKAFSGELKTLNAEVV